MSDIERMRPAQGVSRYLSRPGYGGHRQRSGRSSGGAFGQGQAHDDPVDAVSVHGLDPQALSPEVRAVLEELLGEVQGLHAEVERAQHRARYLEQLADRHAYLPVLNRRALVRRIDTFLQEQAAQGMPGALALFYLDNFEDIRRRHGLDEAEKALVHMARQVAGAVRAADVVGSVGGAGLAVLMLSGALDTVRGKVDRLARVIEARPLDHGHEQVPLRVGAAVVPLEAGDTAEAALGAADARLRAQSRS